jgi:outer membrane protein assembly factor BamD (BamD/ComL family)
MGMMKRLYQEQQEALEQDRWEDCEKKYFDHLEEQYEKAMWQRSQEESSHERG